ncbi:hypothetical protein ZWY2020_047572 [Hordeum vulgare]|nr:hypothetical protein ZWY2020_047570 [Hordeum vulgare]KAI4974292.1 hypothetical protein ZWY2020_047572 [Hordeum vulgare]
MARPAATRRSSTVGSALAVTLVAWLLVLQLLLVAPAAAAATRGISSSGVKKLLGLAKKASKLGRQSRIREARRRNSNTDMLGSAAADDAGFIVLYNVSVGATAQSKVVSGVVDVLNGFVWTTECPAAPVRVPCASQTCRSLVTNETTDACGANTGDRCAYVYMYGAEFNTTGYVANETLTVGVGGTSTMMASALLLGCSNTSTVPLDGAPGSFGFNRGPLSLVSQLSVNKFSYYLTRRGGRSTPLLRSTALPDYYYVKLTSIQVDGHALGGIPAGAFDLAADGSSGGVVMSTLSAVTYLQADAYNALKQAMMGKIKAQVVNGSALGDFDLCYNALSVAALTFPKITLVLDGATLELTTVHYFYRDNVTGLQCLTMLPTPASVPFGSILGSMVQAGTNMIYDVGAGTLTLEEGAAAPVPSQVSLMAVASLLLAWLLLF